MKFIQLKIIDKHSKKQIMQKNGLGDPLSKCICYKNRTFYGYEGCLFELEWLNEEEFIVSRNQHLSWKSCFDDIYFGGAHGIILEIKNYGIEYFQDDFIQNDKIHFICYNPDKQTISRLTKDDIIFNELDLEDTNDAFIQHVMYLDHLYMMVLYMNNGYVFGIKDNILSKTMQSKSINDIYDVKEEEYDRSFKEYKSQFSETAKFAIRESMENTNHISSGYRVGNSRAKYLFHCNSRAKCYQIVAGYNMEQQPHYNHLTQLINPKNYKKLSKIEDIGDYLGAPIWYQPEIKTICNRHIIKVGTIVEFERHLRSTKKLTIICGERSNLLDIAKCEWFGIVDVRDNIKELEETEEFKDSSISRYGTKNEIYGFSCFDGISCFDIKYKGFKLNYFQITNGKILCASPVLPYQHLCPSDCAEFGNAMNGKWYYKTNNDKNQIMAFHESESDKDANCWDLDIEIFEEDKNKDEELLDLENIRDKEKNNKILMNILQEMEISKDIILSICNFCYFIPTLNWIQKQVLNNTWYLHRNKVNSCVLGSYSGVGIFDIDHFYDETSVKNPFENRTEHKWFAFDEENHYNLPNNLWEEMVRQTVKHKNPCCIPFGCVMETKFDYYPCLAKLDPTNKQVVCIRIVCIKKSNFKRK